MAPPTAAAAAACWDVSVDFPAATPAVADGPRVECRSAASPESGNTPVDGASAAVASLSALRRNQPVNQPIDDPEVGIGRPDGPARSSV